MFCIKMYANGFKRVLDFFLSFVALVILSPLLLILVFIGAIMMKGNPFFLQWRPGKKGRDGKEKLFQIIKLRTMTNECDENGNLLSDEKRLTRYGKWVRSTSLDELFQLINVLKGEMALIGPRPQLVRDMVFMTDEQRKRHTVRPGISGLAQIRGRNAISWEGKLSTDIEYVENISFLGDVIIIWKTIGKVLNRENVSAEGMDTAEDYGDYLLRTGKIARETYEMKQCEANRWIGTACGMGR